MFQSPKTGKFESNEKKNGSQSCFLKGFNPLKRGNSNQIP